MLAATRFRDELQTRPPRPTAELVAEIQGRLRNSGLRYVALVVHGPWIEAGSGGADIGRRLRPGGLCAAGQTQRCCGDRTCDGPETAMNCPADCR